MPPTPAQTEVGYHNLWNRASIDPKKQAEINRVVSKGLANKARYKTIESLTGAPWFWVLPTHNRESSMNFNTHLHNGDPLTARTKHVPAGRPVGPPKSGHLPYTFEESAQDALTMAPHSLNKVPLWSVERCLYEWEKYNGWGYLKKGNSPYVWAGTTEYHGGKYIADGVYSSSAWDTQLGCAAVFKQLIAADQEVATRINGVREPTMPKDLVDKLPDDPKFKEVTEKERATKTAGVGTAGAGAAGEAGKATGTVAPENPIVSPFLTYTAIGVGVALFILAAILIARKKDAIVAKWG